VSTTIQPGAVFCDPRDPLRWLVAVDARETGATFIDADTLVIHGLSADTCAQLAEVDYGSERDRALAKVMAHLWKPEVLARGGDTLLSIVRALMVAIEDADRAVKEAHARAAAANAACTDDVSTQSTAVMAVSDHASACGVYEGLGRAVDIVHQHVVPKPATATRAS
jgi:hypothetical protein